MASNLSHRKYKYLPIVFQQTLIDNLRKFFCFKQLPSYFSCILALSMQFIFGLRLLSDVVAVLILPSGNPFYFHAANLLVLAIF